MTSLVEGDGTLLLRCHHLCLLLKTADDAVYGVEEVLLAHHLAVVACCDEGSLVADVGDVGTGESRSLACQHVDVHLLVHLDRLQMHLEDVAALGEVWEVYVYLAVETSCTQKGLVEHVDAVGGSEDDDTGVGAEAVHLGEQGVQRVLSLVVAAHSRVAAAGTADGVNLVDKYYAR